MAGETIYAGSVDRKVYAVDLASGQLRWSSRLGDSSAAACWCWETPCTRPAGAPRAGYTRWTPRPAAGLWRTTTGPVSAPLALVDGMLVAETQRGEMFGLDPAAGTVRWRRTVGLRPHPGGRRVTADRVVATMDSLFRLDRHATARSCAVRGRPERSCRPGSSTGALLVARDDRFGSGRDRPGDLRPRWRAALDAPCSGRRPLRATRSTLRAGGARSTASHRAPDTVPVATPIAELDWPVTSPVTVLDGLVLLGGADGTLRALRPDGTEAWRLQLSLARRAGPLPLDDGILAVGGDGDLHRYRR